MPDDSEQTFARIIDLAGIHADETPSVSETAHAVLIYDRTANTLKVSKNGGAFAPLDAGGEVPLSFIQSLFRNGDVISLVNDATDPGLSKYYGTDIGGARGYFDLPSVGTGGAWELDVDGDLMPKLVTDVDEFWEEDLDGDLQPIAA